MSKKCEVCKKEIEVLDEIPEKEVPQNKKEEEEKKKYKNNKFYIIYIIILIIDFCTFLAMKYIEVNNECKVLWLCIECPCSYDYIKGYSILHLIKVGIIPIISIIIYIINIIKIIKNSKNPLDIIFSSSCLIIVLLINYLTNKYLYLG